MYMSLGVFWSGGYCDLGFVVWANFGGWCCFGVSCFVIVGLLLR